MTATYTNPEGQQWPLHSVQAITFASGFFTAVRADTGQLVHVHRDRLKFHETPETHQEQCPVVPAQSQNPS
jgi:hypothetical protein